MKKPLVRGVHYIPDWADRSRICDKPAAKLPEVEEYKRERAKPQKRQFARKPEATEAIRKALDTTFSRALTIALMVEAGEGGIVPHEELGQTINHANNAIAHARGLLGKDAVINHPNQGYSLLPSVRADILQRAGLSDD